MSNRLKRKLNDLGVDTSSSKANESVQIGTPLPPLEKSKDLGEFVPLWKQEVRDEKGRRRLHGAFTGGFSAGYFNTVGSAEGWTPSTFVSSREGRAKVKASRPEDFMDEEDLQELRENMSLVDTTEEMDFTGGTAAELKRRQAGDDPEQDSIAHALQSTLLPLPADSAGARILKKMGWRLGQGIGPRISLRRRRLQDLQASSPYGTRAVSADDVKVTEEDEEANKHTYALRDTPVLIVERKDNVHGLGYQPGATLQESLGQASKGAIKGLKIAAGFGLGALNDADEDDIDVYDADLNAGRNRLAYDAQHNDDTITIGERTKASNPETRSTGPYSATFRDGSRVLAGFLLSEKPVAEDRWFPLPDIPPNWQPNPRRVLEADKENIPEREVPSGPLPHEKWKSSGMTADERGSMLGETPLHTGPRSVFDYLSEKDRERLKNIASATASGVSPAAAAFSIPRMEPHVAEAALKGFQPFTSDPVKQSRYTAYLLSQASPNSTVAPLQPLPNQHLDKFQKELGDYAEAAMIFKPVTGAMAGRFQSAALIEQVPTMHEGLHQPSAAELEELENKRRKEEEEKISPQAHAAKLGMYGVMTREVKPWQPARLLCKRFGLKDPDPHPDMYESPAPGTRPFTGSTPASEADASFRQTTNANFEAGSSSQYQAQISEASRNLANVGLGEDDTQGRDTLTYQRPTMDVFKAIFASDDEDSDDGNDVDEPEVVKREQEPEATNGTTGPSTSLPDNQPVNPSTFKPTFIPRGGKAKETNKEGRSKEKEKKEKKKKEKKGPLVSFDVEDDAGGLSVKPAKERPKKKKKKDKTKREDDEDEGMWVEKQAPDILKDMETPVVVEPVAPIAVLESNDPNNTSTSNHKGRKRAIDFL